MRSFLFHFIYKEYEKKVGTRFAHQSWLWHCVQYNVGLGKIKTGIEEPFLTWNVTNDEVQCIKTRNDMNIDTQAAFCDYFIVSNEKL